MIISLLLIGIICLALLTFYLSDKFTKHAEQTTPPVGEFIEIDGINIHYVKKGTGPHLIMFHGAGGHLKDFTFDLVDRFAKDYTVIAFDRPGHGYTSLPNKKGATLADQSELLRKAAHELGVKSAYLMGYSFGGALSLHIATHTPEFVRGLILVSAVSMPTPYPIHINYRVMAKPIIGPILMAIATAFYRNTYFRDSYETIFAPQGSPKGYLDHVGVNISVRFKNFVENSRQLNILLPQVLAQSKSYPNLKMPIELIHGTTDVSVPASEHADKFIQVVPHANLVTVKGMGHGTHQLATQQIEAAVKAVSAAA